MTTNNFWSRRGLRLTASLCVSGVALWALPVGSLLGSPSLGAGTSQYTNTTGDDSGNFLGVSGLSNRDVAQAGVIGLSIYGVIAAIHGGAGNASAAGTGAAGASTPAAVGTSASSLPDPLVAGNDKEPIWDTLNGDGAKRFAQFTSVTSLNEVKENPLRDQQNAPYTCFAPTDAAISALPPDAVAKLTDTANLAANKSDNQKVLLKHVVIGKYNVRDLEKLDAGFPLATASGDTLTVTKNPDGTANVNGTPVVREDIRASNGVSHPIATTIK